VLVSSKYFAFQLILFCLHSGAKAKGVSSMNDLDRMVAESMKDVASDEDVSDTEDDELLVRLSSFHY
jgi:hypothetical protein